MCREKINKLKQSTTVRSLYDITSEIVRDLLCGNVDTHATKMKLREDCDECGPGIHDEDRDSYIIGSDVVALFPSIKSLTTGRIIRKRVEGSSLRFPGFNYKQGARYIVMNKHLTGNLAPLRNILPRRRKTQGRTPGMTGKAVNDRQEDDDGEWQWIYPARDPTDLQKRMIIARCCEVGVRMVFENFTYKFGGVVYKQSEGGPIGARLTMSAARIVMMDWAEEYNNILSNSDDEPELLEVYVDDGRQAGKVFRIGTRFDPTSRKLIITEQARQEDIKLEESSNERMARVCLPIMNSINEDLVFTVEYPEEFADGRLPTLDMKMWLEAGKIKHTYFEKSMKTPFLLMKRSAISQHQRCSILANELVRRLSNIDVVNVPHSEVLLVIEQFTQQLKNSEYSCKEARGHIVDGIRGWRNKIERRKRENIDFYRLATNTLVSRVKKKLMEKSTWYKTENKKLEDKPEDWELPEGWKTDREKGEKRKADKDMNMKKRKKVKGVMFVQHTHHSEMAGELRLNENEFERMTDFRMKMVEKAGVKIGSILTESDPWSGQGCERISCWLCDTKLITGKNLKQDCTKRNLVYETYCINCEKEEKEKIAKEEGEGKGEETGRGEEKIKLYKYVGESCRSVWERSAEHLADLKNLNPTSHLLKHIIDKHEGEEVDSIKFGIRVLKFTRTSFERQILESVKIQQERKDHYLLNSRSEFNRSAVPRLSSKIGEKDFKRWEKEGEKEKEKEEILKQKIEEMKKMREKKYQEERKQANKSRQPKPSSERAGKRQKVGVGEDEYREKRGESK